MPYSPVQIPNLANLRRIDTDTVLYVSPSGNDSTGTGTTAAPYLTLSHAMGVAREYVIAGTATLTIRLMKGEHTVTGNVDLYHPQGANLIIEGDPSEFKQRTLYTVDSYTWNLANFAGGGHTATIRVFDGTTAGATFHGFTGTDQGMYFTIVNTAIGARSNYRTNGASGGTAAGGIHGPVYDGFGNDTANPASSYSSEFYGDRFFNHGYSFEDGNAVLGIGRILGATTAGTSLSVQFNNANYDGRCPAWQFDGGINNTIAWGDLASNYPETQYSVPTGYYGWSQWKTENGAVSYPTRGAAQRYITKDPFVMSTYPVVIRADYSNNSGTLFLRNGTVRAIRNIFFANNSSAYTVHGGVTGATLNWSQGLSSLVDQNIATSTNGVAIALENSNLAIRHLGFLGTGTAISAYSSKLTAYTETTLDTVGTATTSQTIRYAVMNSLDNAPLICTTQCRDGIVSKNSVIDFTDGSGLNTEYSTDYRDKSIYLDTLDRSVTVFGGEFLATSLTSHGNVAVPTFNFRALVPVFPGTTAAGATTAFNSYTTPPVTGGHWNAYPLATVSIDGLTLGYVNNWRRDTATSVTGIGGATASSTYIGSITPTEYQMFQFYGVKAAPGGLSYMQLVDVRRGITSNNTANAGGTLEVKFFRDAAGTSLASSYTVGKHQVLVRGANGYTMGVQGILPAGVDGSSGAAFVQSWTSYGEDAAYLGGNILMGERRNAIGLYDRAKMVIEKSMILNNGGYISISMSDSDLHIGDSQSYSDSTTTVQRSGETSALNVGGFYNYTTGSLCVTGYAIHALYAWRNCTVKIGNCFFKHPFHVYPVDPTERSFRATPIRIGNGSSANISQLYTLQNPAITPIMHQNASSTTVGSWISRTGQNYGYIPYTSGLVGNGSMPAILVDNHSKLTWGRGREWIAVMHDGGNPQNSNTTGSSGLGPNFFVVQCLYGSEFVFDATSQNATVTNSKFRQGSDSRATVANRKIAKRSTGTDATVYNRGLQLQRVWQLHSTPAEINNANYTVSGLNFPPYTFTANTSGVADGVTYAGNYVGFGGIYPSA